MKPLLQFTDKAARLATLTLGPFDRALYRARAAVGANLPIFVFLVTYLLTLVIGNLLYLTPFGIANARRLMVAFTVDRFDHFASWGYWLLLALPLFVVPIAATLVKRPLAKTFAATGGSRREINFSIYLALSILFHLYCVRTLQEQSVFQLNLASSDAINSVEMRFLIQERVGFAFRIIVNSLFPFLIIYAFLRAVHTKKISWWAVYLVNLVLDSLYLISLNMKWPVLVLGLVNLIALFVTINRQLFLKTLLMAAFYAACYVGVSSFVLRFGAPAVVGENRPAPQLEAVEKPSVAVPERSSTAEPGRPAARSETRSENAPETRARTPRPTGRPAAPDAPLSDTGMLSAFGQMLLVAVRTAGTGRELVEHLLASVVNRMAIAYPYYYEEFTQKGAICGTLWDRVLRKPSPCAPSIHIYNTMYEQDQVFRDRGTATAAVNVSAYALGGWPSAIIATVLAGFLLGAFAAFGGVQASSTLKAAIWVMGAQVAYFLTQLPFEGSLVYDHGALWWSGLALVASGVSVGAGMAGANESIKGASPGMSTTHKALAAASVALIISAFAALVAIVPSIGDSVRPRGGAARDLAHNQERLSAELANVRQTVQESANQQRQVQALASKVDTIQDSDSAQRQQLDTLIKVVEQMRTDLARELDSLRQELRAVRDAAAPARSPDAARKRPAR